MHKFTYIFIKKVNLNVFFAKVSQTDPAPKKTLLLSLSFSCTMFLITYHVLEPPLRVKYILVTQVLFNMILSIIYLA